MFFTVNISTSHKLLAFLPRLATLVSKIYSPMETNHDSRPKVKELGHRGPC